MQFTVYGRPITQGSKIRTRWSMRDANGATLDPWRDNVRSRALGALALSAPFGVDPVSVQITFTFVRPNSHYGTGRNKAMVKDSAPPFPASHAIGDIDKLVRACLDAITDAGIWADDSQVVELHAGKCWIGTPMIALDRPGAVITITGANVQGGAHVHSAREATS